MAAPTDHDHRQHDVPDRCGDYGVDNALGLMSYLMAGTVAGIYLRYALREMWE